MELEKLLVGPLPMEQMLCQFAAEKRLEANMLAQEINCC